MLLTCLPACTVMAAEVPGVEAGARSHVVPLSELHQRPVEATAQREKDLQQLNRFFSSGPVSQALQTSKLDGERVRQAAAQLDDQELARLAERSRQVESDFAAGALNNQQLTYIIIALATAVIILVIVAR
jgi:hypothetical protein